MSGEDAGIERTGNALRIRARDAFDVAVSRIREVSS